MRTEFLEDQFHHSSYNFTTQKMMLVYFALFLPYVVAHQRDSLLDLWMNNSAHGPVLDKWDSYAETYQKFFQSYKYGQEIKMMEIGVQSGGSMVAWKKWFSDAEFQYVGIDINEHCKQYDQYEGDPNIHIEIGSQDDPAFLLKICDKYGPFDLILDDGGHFASQIMISLRTLFPTCLKEGGFYVIEDVCTMAFDSPEMVYFEDKTVAQHVAKIYESMHSSWSEKQAFYDPIFSGHVKNIHLANSMVLLEKGSNRHPNRIMSGNIRIPFRTTVTTEDGSLTFYVANNSEDFDKPKLYKECYEACYLAILKDLNVSVSNDLSIAVDGVGDTVLSADGIQQVRDCATDLMPKVIRKAYGCKKDMAPFLYDYVCPGCE